MVKKSLTSIVLRGALCGALGGLIILLVGANIVILTSEVYALFVIGRAIRFLPLVSAVGAFFGGFLGASLFRLKTALRKLELICGAATALAAILFLIWVLIEWHSSLIAGKQFSLGQTLFFVMYFFAIPGVLVGVGSYAHAVRERYWGRLLLGFAFLWGLGSFLFFLFTAPILFFSLNPWSLFYLSFLLTASLSLIFSFTAGKEAKHTM